MDPNLVHTLLDRANELLEAGKPEDSLRCLDEIEPPLLDPEDRVELGAIRAWAFSELGRNAEALDVLEPLLDEFTAAPRLLGTLGVVLSNGGDLSAAREAIEEAIRIDDSDESNWANLGLIFERLREFRLAQETYEHAMKLGVSIDWLLQRQAAVLAEMGQMGPARAALRRCLSLTPEDADAWTTLATLHCEEGEFPQAFECFERAAALQPDCPNLRLNWGMAALRCGDLTVAHEQLWHLIRSDGASYRPPLLRAMVTEAENDNQAALAEFDAAVEAVRGGGAQDLACVLELAMDHAARHDLRPRSRKLFALAYTANVCTVELCEAFRQTVGRRRAHASWFSLLIEADYRPGLVEVRPRSQFRAATLLRHVRNIQVVAADRDDAVALALRTARRHGERNVQLREIVGEEPVTDDYIGVYEIEREALVFGEDAE